MNLVLFLGVFALWGLVHVGALAFCMAAAHGDRQRKAALRSRGGLP